MSYAVRDYFCARTDNHSPTRHYPPRKTGCCTNLLFSRFCWELTVLPWRLQGFTLWFETQLQPRCLFESYGNPQLPYQYRASFNLFKIWRYITSGEKFTKYSKICIFQHCFLFIFFADICGLINNFKTFNRHVLLARLLTHWYRNCIKVSEIV